MGSVIGNNLKISIFGESHGAYVGGTIDGLPHGKKIDIEYIRNELFLRSGKGGTSTSRIEKDDFEIISGVFNGYTTGMPLTILIKNNNKISKDYELIKDIPRPSHSDYVAMKKYDRFNDYRGGGHFSARLTAPITALGAICRKILLDEGVIIKSHIKSIGSLQSVDFLDVDFIPSDELFPVYDFEIKKIFQDEILKCREKGNSIGGSVQCKVSGVSLGYGSPIFDNIEGHISRLIFSIPGVKALEFGRGIEMSKSYGNIVNDQYFLDKESVCTKTNNNGGINGGITNGNEIIFTAYFKPTPSISIEQNSVDLVKNEERKLVIDGRHDPCIVVRGVCVVNNLIAFGILDMML
ncbi:MAG: chorismate synthase [Lachnospirales bacterium]